LPVKTGVKIEKEEKIRQYAIYNIEHFDTRIFEEKFSIKFQKQFPRIYKELHQLKLITEQDHIIKLTTKGLNYRDIISKEFFSPKIIKLENAHRYTVNIIIFGFS
jgi:hypothetical protein